MIGQKFKDMVKLAKLNFFESLLRESFRRIGVFIAHYPWWVLFSVFIVFLASISGFFFLEFETDIYNLFSIKNSMAYEEQHMVETTFATNPRDNFEIGRFTNLVGANRVIITIRDNKTAFRRPIFEEIAQFDQMVRNVTFHLNLPGLENKTLKYQDICSKDQKGRCYRNQVLDLLDFFEEEDERVIPIVDYPLTVKKDDEEVIPFFTSLGGVELDGKGRVLSAQAVCLLYFTNPDFKTNENPWENRVLEIVLNQNFTHINISYLSFNLLGEEMYKTAFGILPYGVYTCTLMVIVAFVGCSFGNCITTKSWIGVIGIVASFLGGVSGFGFCQHLRIPMVPPSISILFVIIGVGMDDAFVILAAWKRTSPNAELPERMGRTLEHSGMAITISSITNFLCFLIGTATPFSFAYYFCSYAAVCIAYDYVFTVCVVGASLAIMGRGEAAGRNAIFCFPAAKDSSETGKKSYFYKFLLLGSLDTKEGGEEEDEENLNKSDVKPRYLADKCGYAIAKFVSTKFGKCFVLSIYVLYLMCSGWGAYHLKENFDETHLFYKESYTNDHHGLFYKYFSNYMFRLQLVIREPLPYWEPKTQEMVESLTQEIEGLPFMSGSQITESWLRDYKIFLKASRVFLWNSDYTQKKIFLRTLRNPFLRFKHFKRFNNDIAFNENFTEIVASRILVQSSHVRSTYGLYDKVLALRKIVAKYPFKVSAYHPFFLIADHLEVVSKVTITSLSAALFSMMVIFFFFIPNIKYLVATGLNLLSIELGTIGFLVLWGVNLETMTTVTLIMSMGFCIDNISHVICSYINCKGVRREERLNEALGFVFSPIMLGFVSTVMATFALVFAGAIVYLTIFKIVFTTLLISTLHSLFILPIILRMMDIEKDEDYSGVTKEPLNIVYHK